MAHDFQDMDGEPGDFTVSEGHEHPLVQKMANKNVFFFFGVVFRASILSTLYYYHIVYEPFGNVMEFCFFGVEPQVTILF